MRKLAALLVVLSLGGCTKWECEDASKVRCDMGEFRIAPDSDIARLKGEAKRYQIEQAKKEQQEHFDDCYRESYFQCVANRK